jgi:alpha-tubulin suppressor-like RCC1 family protein
MRTGILRSPVAGIIVSAMTGLLIFQSALAWPVSAAAGPRSAASKPAASKPAASGPLLAWGADQDGELGDGSMVEEEAPVAVNPPADLRVTSARVSQFGIGVTARGQVWAWGRGQQGELGNGAKSGRLHPVRVRLPKGVKVTAARAGFDFAVAVTTARQVLSWGLGNVGQLGNGHRRSSDIPVRARLPRGVHVTAVSAGGDFAVALTSTGKLLAWGNNDEGQLGDGRRASTDKPVWVRLPRSTRITAVGAGVGHVLAVTSTGRLLAWGGNELGHLGDGTTKLRRSPVRVHLPAGVKVVAAYGGLLHSVALTTTGRVLAWGDNERGQLGNGTLTASHVPVWVHIPHGVRIRALAAGRSFSLALTRSGKVLAWGDDAEGQLGDGSHHSRDVPFQIQVPGKVISIGAGCEASSSMAVVTKIID